MYYSRALIQNIPAAGEPLPFIASTNGIARDGMVIRENAWELDNYRNNPIVLWAHDYIGQRLTIGRGDVDTAADGLRVGIHFDQADDFARTIERKYRDGYLFAVSVGWNSLQTERSNNPAIKAIVTRAELLDISAVPVPGDPNALMERQQRAMSTYAVEVPDIEITIPIWRGVATAMVDLLHDRAMSEETRHKIYIALERAYKALGQTPPEYLSIDEMAAFSANEMRGLFLADEMRVGAMLNSRNRGDLTQAIALIQGVMDRASKEEKPPMEDEPKRNIAPATLDALRNAIQRLETNK